MARVKEFCIVLIHRFQQYICQQNTDYILFRFQVLHLEMVTADSHGGGNAAGASVRG